jgi:hypothetical protein
MPVPVGCGLQRPDHFEVTADVPGFTKDQVNVEVHEVGADSAESLPMTWLLRSTTGSGCLRASASAASLPRKSFRNPT